MEKKPNILEQAFDHLSSFKHLNLRKVMRFMWLFTILNSGGCSLLAWFEILKGSTGIELGFIKNQIMLAGGACFFGYILRLWDKRDKEKKLSQTTING